VINMDDLFSVKVNGCSIAVKQEENGWFFSHDNNDVLVASEIGLPRWSCGGVVSVCLPICYRNIYDKVARDRGVTIMWSE